MQVFYYHMVIALLVLDTPKYTPVDADGLSSVRGHTSFATEHQLARGDSSALDKLSKAELVSRHSDVSGRTFSKRAPICAGIGWSNHLRAHLYTRAAHSLYGAEWSPGKEVGCRRHCSFSSEDS